MLAAFSHSELEAPHLAQLGDEITRSLTRSENAPPASTEPVWAKSPNKSTFEPAVFAAPTISSRANVPAREALVDHDELSGLRRLSLIAWFVSARAARSLAALGELG